MKCPKCSHENPLGQKFCGECGTRLEVVCAACQTSNPPGQKFCGECGAPMVVAGSASAAVTPVRAERFASPADYTPKHLADKILTSRAALEGERKIVTVMFADVAGFTGMSERLDPEDVHGIMDRSFEVIMHAVHRYEGTINQFLGDGVMALFGAPIAHEDHVHRALRAALDVQRGLVPLGEEVRRTHGVEFRMRIGLNTGLVVVGAIGKDLRMDYTAVGDTTNLAARLMALAGPGQIVLSDATRRVRGRSFTFEDLGEHSVKGKAEPVRAWALTDAVQQPTRQEVSRERSLTPLMGRTAELGRLVDAYQRTDEGQGAIVYLVGEPGAGKSRLLYEFLRGLEDGMVLELETICVSYGRTIPYRPVLELLRRYLGLAENMAGGDVRRRAAECLARLDLEGEERLTLLTHFLGVSVPAEFLTRVSAAELKERTRDLLCEVFVRASASTLVVLVIENVHWADASSLEILAHLARQVGRHRILMAITARPGFSAPWLERPVADRIDLGVLGLDDTRAMIGTLLGAEIIAPSLLAVLADKGAGNPLYLEELVLQLQETGGILVEDGVARVGREDVRVPSTIQDIIAARVDRLDSVLKLSLQGAAVIGRRFGVSLLSQVVETPTDETDRRLRELHGSDFVFPSASDPELMYSFKHALTQDVVYAGLLERRRRQYHRAAGLGLEQLYAGHIDDMVELLVHHFGRSGDDDKAVDYALAAAEKAQRRWANIEALAFFEDALKRLTTMPDTPPNRLRRIDAVVKQAELMFALGRHAEHVQALTAIREIVDTTADAPRKAAWYYWTGFMHSLTGARPDISIEYCQAAAQIANQAGLVEIEASANSCLGQVYAYAGRLREGLEAGERALAVFEAHGNVWWACRTLWGLSLTAIPMGDWPRSLDYCRRALAYGEQVNDRRLKVVGWWRSGWTHIQRGDAATGIECCQKALDLSPSPFDAAMARAAMGYGLVKLDRINEGIAMLTEAVDWFEQSRLTFTRAWYAIWLADSHLRGGDRATARQLAEEVLAKSRDSGYRYFEGLAERLLGTALLAEDRAGAVAHLDAALAILEPAGVRNDVARIFVAQAELRRVARDVPGARDALERALAMFEALGTLDEPARARGLLDQLA
jgi:class 3 adenylate cyclase/tetratricopeptide (TPR) repeat protein